MTPSKPIYMRADQVLDTLRTMLSSPDYPPGTKLAPERELAKFLNTSRRSLREALDILEAEKKLARAPGRGTIVLDPEETSNALFNVIQHTSPLELINARFVLEPAMAAAAAIHATSYDLENIQYLYDKTLSSTSHEEWEEWDGKLHKSLGEATHNHLLQHFYEVITEARKKTEWGQLRKKTLTHDTKLLYIEQHEAIVKAIKNRDPKQAAKAMRSHLTAVRQNIMGF